MPPTGALVRRQSCSCISKHAGAAAASHTECQHAACRTVALAAGLQAQSGAPAAGAAASAEPTAAYVHLPFCKRKCRYCDFPVVRLPSGRVAQSWPGPACAARAALHSPLLRKSDM